MGTARSVFNALIAHFRGNGHRDPAQQRLLAPPTRDDVLHAFRLILGREPENESAISAHLRVPNVAELRRVFLDSDEFKGKYKAMHPDVVDDPFLNAARRTIVLIHLQKTGGTSLRDIVGCNFAPDRRCPIFENKLHVLSLAELARYDFFSGHFDIATIKLIPRDKIMTLCMFREPRNRLISFYRFLRSHPGGDEFARDRLVQLAHTYSAEDFFSRPEVRSYSAINNHYAFALGRSFLWFDKNRNNLSAAEMGSVLLDAKLQIRALTALGITERFAESVRLICHSLDLAQPSVIEKKHVTDEFADFDARFRRVEQVEMTPALIEATHDLVRYDAELYQFALTDFERRLQEEFGEQGT